MGMILRIASSRIVGQGDIVGRSGYFSLNLSANSVMRGRLDARRTLKSLVADLRVIKKLMSELTPADMEMIYCCEVNDFSTDTLYPVIVFTSAPTLEKEHTLTLRWTTVEGDVKTASVTCTPEVDPALQ